MIIDISSTVPTREFLISDLMLAKGTGYLKLLGHNWGHRAGLPDAEIEDLLARGEDAFIDRIAEKLEVSGMTSLEFLIAALDRAGVTRSALHNFDSETVTGAKPVPNDRVAEIVSRYPDRFIGFIGVDPHKGTAAVVELERGVRELGLRAVSLQPFMQRIHANDKRFYPIYEKSVELDIPVWIHTSINWLTNVTMDFGRPIYVDQVACDFPKLKIIAGHGGWPWVNEMVGVVWRHSNVYVDISAHRPRYFVRPGSGWEMLLHFGSTVIQDKVLFGSDWLGMGLPLEQLIGEVHDLPLRREIITKWLGGNAAKLFGINC